MDGEGETLPGKEDAEKGGLWEMRGECETKVKLALRLELTENEPPSAPRAAAEAVPKSELVQIGVTETEGVALKVPEVEYA